MLPEIGYKGSIKLEAPILLVADFANVDAGGKLNIIGAFNKISTAVFPVICPPMYLAIRLIIEPGEFDIERVLRVILFDSDANEKWRTPDLPFSVAKIEKEDTVQFHPIVTILQLKFEEAGRYEFRLFVGDNGIGAIPFEVIKAAQS